MPRQKQFTEHLNYSETKEQTEWITMVCAAEDGGNISQTIRKLVQEARDQRERCAKK